MVLEKPLVKGETDFIILDPFAAALLERQGKRNVTDKEALLASRLYL